MVIWNETNTATQDYLNRLTIKQELAKYSNEDMIFANVGKHSTVNRV